MYKGTCFCTVCENHLGEACNVHGTNPECGPKSENSCGSGSVSFCKPGYKGRRCDECDSGAFEIKAKKKMCPSSNEGIQCRCNL